MVGGVRAGRGLRMEADSPSGSDFRTRCASHIPTAPCTRGDSVKAVRFPTCSVLWTPHVQATRHSWEEGVWGSGLSGFGLATTSHLRGPQEGGWVSLAESAGKRGSEMGTIR